MSQIMRRAGRWLLFVLPVVPVMLLSGCASGVTHATFKLPHCDPSLDTCLEALHITLQGNPDVITIGSIRIHTHTKPRAFVLYTALQIWVGKTGKWATIDAQTYHIGKLPLPGKTKTMDPVLEAYCAPRSKWRMTGHLLSVSSTGQHQNSFFYFPGKPNNRHYFIGSLKPITRGRSLRYGIRIRSCVA